MTDQLREYARTIIAKDARLKAVEEALEFLLKEQTWYGRDCGCGYTAHYESDVCPECRTPRGSPTVDEYIAIVKEGVDDD